MTQKSLASPTHGLRFPHDPLRDAQGPCMALLEQDGVLAVQGADAARFLQGQITCDVNALAVGSSVRGARCNPKGRMQSTFRLLRIAEDRYLLGMAAELVERQRLELAKYAVFFKAQLSDDSQRLRRVGLWGEGIEAALEKAGYKVPQSLGALDQSPAGLILKVGEHAFEFWLEADTAESIMAQLASHTTAAHPEDWRLRAIRDGQGEVFPSTYESFIPQMLNLQRDGGVSFRKGCYTGQEIVARMQYLGTLKRRMYRLLSEGEQPSEPGAAVIDSDSGRTVGEVVMAARATRGSELLAVLQKDAAQSALRLEDINGPSLMLTQLPYESELVAQEAASEPSPRD